MLMSCNTSSSRAYTSNCGFITVFIMRSSGTLRGVTGILCGVTVFRLSLLVFVMVKNSADQTWLLFLLLTLSVFSVMFLVFFVLVLSCLLALTLKLVLMLGVLVGSTPSGCSSAAQ
jgi:hypothetical protein